MKPAISPATVPAAEMQALRSAQDFRDNLLRVRVAFNAKLASPPALVATVAATGLFGFWLARRTRIRLSTPVAGRSGGATAAALRLMLAFMTRHGLQRLLAGFRN